MEAPMHPGSIVILDFGGQYAHLIGNRVRRLGAYSQIIPPETVPEAMKDAAGIILSGGPQSVYEKGSPQADPKILDLGVPVLGLCYGHQWIAHVLGGKVSSGMVKEYGPIVVDVERERSPLFDGLPRQLRVWMSHGDEVRIMPKDFQQVASSPTCPIAAMQHLPKKIFGIQFHIEVTHTEHGLDILDRFVQLCRPAPWSVESFAAHVGGELRKAVGDRKVFMLVSGGVDSTVAFTLLNETIGFDRVQGLLVDTGLMRKNEVAMIRQSLERLNIQNLHVEDASDEFFANLKGVCDPEEKRRIIGDTFLAVADRISRKMGLGGWPADRSAAVSTSDQPPSAQGYGGQPSLREGWMLGQGTIYPDTIETKGTKHADHIKTHHNRVPAVQAMIERGLVIEPLKELYKDEVRRLGEEIGLPHELVWRHPFPGPGLGVRVLCAEKEDKGLRTTDNGLSIALSHAVLPVKSVGVQGDGRTYRHALVVFHDHPAHALAAVTPLAASIPNHDPRFNRVLLCTSHEEPVDFVFTPGSLTRERADLLREADAIVDEVMRQEGLYEKIWQFPVVLLPVGTSAGGPTSAKVSVGGQSIVLRPVESTEAMTANAAHLPANVIEHMTQRMLELPGIDCVFYDLTSKPPATIEWE